MSEWTVLGVDMGRLGGDITRVYLTDENGEYVPMDEPLTDHEERGLPMHRMLDSERDERLHSGAVPWQDACGGAK